MEWISKETWFFSFSVLINEDFIVIFTQHQW